MSAPRCIAGLALIVAVTAAVACSGSARGVRDSVRAQREVEAPSAGGVAEFDSATAARLCGKADSGAAVRRGCELRWQGRTPEEARERRP